jgi:hypothetical protein
MTPNWAAKRSGLGLLALPQARAGKHFLGAPSKGRTRPAEKAQGMAKTGPSMSKFFILTITNSVGLRDEIELDPIESSDDEKAAQDEPVFVGLNNMTSKK